VAITAPVPRPPCRFRCRTMTAGCRSHVILGLRRSTTVVSRSCPTSLRRFARSVRRRFTADESPELDHPFTPPPLFLKWVRGAYLVVGQAYRFAATCYDVRALRPGFSNPRRDGGRDLLPFLLHHAASLPGAVDAWRAARRPFVSSPVPVLPVCTGLPDRDEAPTAPPTSACAAAV
jgi:hypothetical protein